MTQCRKAVVCRNEKLPLTIGIIVITLLIGWGVARFTGVLQLYTMPSGGNEPTIKTNSIITISNIPQVKRNDFIAYNAFDSSQQLHYIGIRRLCAVGGDEVTMRSGVLFVNGTNADAGLTLRHLYTTTATEAGKIANELPDGDAIIASQNGDTTLIYLDDAVARNGHWKVTRYIPAPVAGYPYFMSDHYQHPEWTTENFGPVVVPPHTYFLLGDNRDNALDSRYQGFIPERDIVGVKL